ncbi:hypothetical protein TVAG_151870 [Trichomonas vaginalis G3]|uniref:Uncharacterized protein n=1 Tax=Trichomonas vaginalis (strain ATCC PRA-98 / G3) TaxID=412133 RepID=A2ELV2_TRIV3|nr:hypothetical protein TVAGG3_0400900 [Trichomonas vaginalis G3]EAY06380.1 hypothetical protein TVAG_151870 [Trichomonas vaginalis G3]KAI5534682.1 hypothetical protein TVAGG3_0400900 [Trichomonas vaginalis G3]|eukprot:XP_001318603.1 hypothetical protein [Trichomonas vaginalis G3]
MKSRKGSFQTLSKFGRLHFDDADTPDIGDIDEILSELKSFDRKSRVKRKSLKAGISERLLAGEKAQRRPRKITKTVPKHTKQPPTIPQATFKNDSSTDVPGADQYNPDYEVLLKRAPSLSISNLPKTVNYDPDTMTMRQMVDSWSNIRIANYLNSRKEIQEPTYNEFKKEDKVPGIISRTQPTYVKNRFETDTPAPNHYNISRDVSKSSILPFHAQAPRPDNDSGPDRTHFGLAASIDATKPRSVSHLLPPNISRDKSKDIKTNIWEEIENEQKILMNQLQKPKDTKNSAPKPVKPRYVPKPDVSPFAQFMRTEAPDVEYDVEGNLRSLNKKIPPRENFGRRLDDSDRAIYQKSEAPDVIYPNTNDAWLKTIPSSGNAPSFDQMHDRKEAYAYMPKTCGGGYTYVETNWNRGQAVRFDLMGKRKLVLEVPPQYKQGRSSSQCAAVFN